MRTNLFVPVRSNEFVLAVDAFGASISGRIYHAVCPEGQQFNNLADLALAVENVLSLVEGPSFSRPPAEPASLAGAVGALGTFYLEVLFRQHYSWQGKLTWIEQNQETSFRSFLELTLQLRDIFAE